MKPTIERSAKRKILASASGGCRRIGPLVLLVSCLSPCFAAEERLASTEIKDERWGEKFDHFQRLDRKIRQAFPEVFRDEPVAYGRPAIEARSALELYEAMLGRELAMLSATVNRLAASRRETPPLAVQSHIQTIRRSSQTYSVDLPATATIQNVALRMSNVGRAAIINPRLLAGGKRDWFDADAIRREALAGAASDRDKAVAIWRFLAENRYHFTPAHDSTDLHDPVRFLNVYGYGFCDDSAANFAEMARGAGLDGRVWGLNGHVVAEAFYDGAWHLFDPDGKSYYLDEDGQTIASVETVARQPERLRNLVTAGGNPPYAFEKLKQLYTTTDDNKVSEWYRRTSSSSHRMAFVLRPGETIVRHWRGRGRFFTSRYYDEPPVYGRGEWIYQPPLEGPIFREDAASIQSVEVGQFRDRPALLATGQTASFSHEFRLPYPLLDGSLEIGYCSDHENNELAVTIAAGGGRKHQAWSHRGAGDGRAIIPLGCYFPNGYGDPAYGCQVTVEMRKTGETLAVRALSYHFDFQLAPASLPALEAGATGLRYGQESETSPVLEIEHQYVLAPKR